jgi:hypothetical protein
MSKPSASEYPRRRRSQCSRLLKISPDWGSNNQAGGRRLTIRSTAARWCSAHPGLARQGILKLGADWQQEKPRDSIQKLAPARLLGKMDSSGRCASIYKLRTYNFANKWLVRPCMWALMRHTRVGPCSDKASKWAARYVPFVQPKNSSVGRSVKGKVDKEEDGCEASLQNSPLSLRVSTAT